MQLALDTRTNTRMAIKFIPRDQKMQTKSVLRLVLAPGHRPPRMCTAVPRIRLSTKLSFQTSVVRRAVDGLIRSCLKYVSCCIVSLPSWRQLMRAPPADFSCWRFVQCSVASAPCTHLLHACCG